MSKHEAKQPFTISVCTLMFGIGTFMMFHFVINHAIDLLSKAPTLAVILLNLFILVFKLISSSFLHKIRYHKKIFYTGIFTFLSYITLFLYFFVYPINSKNHDLTVIRITFLVFVLLLICFQQALNEILFTGLNSFYPENAAKFYSCGTGASGMISAAWLKIWAYFKLHIFYSFIFYIIFSAIPFILFFLVLNKSPINKKETLQFIEESVQRGDEIENEDKGIGGKERARIVFIELTYYNIVWSICYICLGFFTGGVANYYKKGNEGSRATQLTVLRTCGFIGRSLPILIYIKFLFIWPLLGIFAVGMTLFEIITLKFTDFMVLNFGVVGIVYGAGLAYVIITLKKDKPFKIAKIGLEFSNFNSQFGNFIGASIGWGLSRWFKDKL